MKRKLVMLTEPEQTRKEGRVATVQTAEGILIMNLYRDKKLDRRYCMNLETGEYQTWFADSGMWRQEKIKAALGGRYDGCYGMYGNEKVAFDPPSAEKQAEEAIKKLENCNWRKGAVEMLDWVEYQYVSRQREEKETRRIERLNQLMGKVPDVPDNFMKWTLKTIGEGKHYAFWDKQQGVYGCTSCGKIHTAAELPGKHNLLTACPSTGEAVMIKRMTKQIQIKSKVCLMQNVDEGTSVCRHFDARVTWEGTTEQIELSEAARIMPMRRTAEPCKIYYNQCNRFRGCARFDRHNPANRRVGKCYLYPEGIRESLEGTHYRGWIRNFEMMAHMGIRADYNNLMTAMGDRNLMGVMEYLIKGRFFRLAQEVAQDTWERYRGELDITGKTAQEVLGIGDVQIINRIRAENGGKRMVRWMRWSDQSGKKVGKDVMDWLEKEQIDPEDVAGTGMSIQKLMNYILRQQAESYPEMKALGIIGQYKDYLSACKRMGKDMSDEMVYKPRELKRRHDELVEEIRKVQMIEEMKRNEEAARKREDEMREKYPGAEENLAEAAGIYGYTGGEYCVIVPKTLSEIVLEGSALHHCVGSSERYFERIMRRETYVFFLRRTAEQDVPYYTLEAEPGGTIRQTRTMYDEETGIEDVRAFLRTWQQEIKKRLTKREKELAKISAVKREENIKELQEKNNTRVLKALMEDFMEAV